MSILSKIFKRSNNSLESLLSIQRGGGKANSGVLVNDTTSLTMSAVYSALTIISETMSTVPLQIFVKTEEGRELFTNHPLYSILHDKANRTESAQSFRETFNWNIEMRGIGLAEKIRDIRGNIVELWNISPDSLVQITLDEGMRLQFQFNDGTIAGPERIFYCYGPGRNGLKPRGRIEVAREAVGLGLAAQEFGSRFFGQGTSPSGFITYEGKELSKIAHDRLSADLNAQHQGLDNSHNVVLLENGMKFTQASMSNEDSQFLETRKFQIAEVARFFNIKSHMIGDLERATFSNIEHMGIEATTYCWRPRAVRLQQAINTQLLSPLERGDVYAEHNLNGLMQGDLAGQAAIWQSLIHSGVLNADEVRAMMNMNSQADGQGKIYLKPMNMSDKSKPEEPKLRTMEDYRTWGESLAADYAKEYGTKFDHASFVRSVGKLLGALEKRGLGDTEPTRMRNAFRYAGMQAGGITHVIWRSHCNLCQHLDGKVVPLGEAFVDGIKHPPIANGCNCNVEAVK